MIIENFKNNRWATEVILFLIFLVTFHFSTRISLLFQIEPGWTKIYLPTVAGVILVHWFGPRVLLPLFVNAILSAGLWLMPNPYFYPLYALPETIVVFLSWLFFSKLAGGKCWLPDVKNLLYYILLGVLAPYLIYSIWFELQYYYISDLGGEISAYKAFNIALAESTTGMTISVLVLYFFSGYLSKLQSSLVYGKAIGKKGFGAVRSMSDFVIATVFIIVILILFNYVDYIDYWFVYGLIAILISVRWGFASSILASLTIFVFFYFINFLDTIQVAYSNIDLVNETRVYLGLNLLFAASFIIGRVVSDNKNAGEKLEGKNTKLKKVNEELDRFVYSVSHDLSSPLKSITGLVNLANIEKDPKMIQEYLCHINKSTVKLEAFIKELLDFSRNARTSVTIQRLNLEEFLKSSLNTYEYDSEFERLHVSLDLKRKYIYSDELRLSIIFNNLISNAIKYQTENTDKSFLKIKSQTKGDKVVISFADNGLGIEKEVQEKVFDLFYRGNVKSTGSGLGLYIVKESVGKLEGHISLTSSPGTGSTFFLELPDHKKENDVVTS